MKKRIWIKTPQGEAAIKGGRWSLPARHTPGDGARRAAFLERLNEDFAAAYLTDYANARAAVEALGGEILSPAPEAAPATPKGELPRLY